MNAVVCPTSGTCIATGHYYNGRVDLQGVLETLDAGQWTDMKAPLPPDADSKPSSDLDVVVCPTPARCVAAGYYRNRAGNEEGLFETLAGGRWTASRAPLPTDAASNARVRLRDIACAAVRDCVAVGRYNGSGHGQALVETLADGRWAATTGPLPGDASNTNPYLISVACPASDSCVATGGYTDTKQNRQGILDAQTVQSATIPNPRH
jgi:hypothetical protein